MADQVRSVVVKVRGDVSGLTSAYGRAGRATDEFADRLERAEANSRLLSQRQEELGGRLRENSTTLRANNRELDRMGRSASDTAPRVRRLGDETENLSRRQSNLGRSSRSTENQLNSLSGRLGLLVQGAIALGPALTAGALIPIAGLAAQGIAGAAGLGVLIGSFSGVKDAVTAMNKTALDPSIANLQAEHDALKSLSPAAQDMARKIQGSAIPALKDLRDLGASTAFPGLLKGADEASSRLPRVKRLVGEVGIELGHLGDDAGKSLAGDDWDKVFNYALRTTPGLLDDITKSLGNVLLAGGNTIAALDPLTQDWSGGLLDFTEKLVKSSAKLDSSQGFKDFLSYAQKTGPEVLKSLGQIAGAFVAIGKAGAPVSGPLIKGLGAVAQIVGKVADSDFGTPLVAGALAMTAYGKATDLAARAQIRLGVASGTAGAAGAAGAAGGAASRGGLLALGPVRSAQAGYAKLSTRLRGTRADLRSMSREFTGLGRVQSTALSGFANTSGAAQRTRASLVGLGKGAAVVGAIGIAASGAADGINLTNTATLGLLGSMIPGGIAVGAAAGFLLDAKSAAKETGQAFDDLQTSVSHNDLLGGGKALAKARANSKDLNTTSGIGDALSDFQKFTGNVFSGHDERNDPTYVDKQAKSFNRLKDAVKGLSIFTSAQTGVPEAILGPKSSLKDYQSFLNHAAPALDALGVSSGDLQKHAGDGEYLSRLSTKVLDYNKSLDGIPARTAAVGDSISQIASGAVSAAEGSSQLASALNSLLVPGLNAEAAADNLAAAYSKMKDTLSANRGSGFGSKTAGSRANDSATRDVVSGITDRLSTAAGNGASAAKLGGILKRSRQQFLQEGQAAGFSADAIRKRANELGLTPKLVQTVLRTKGLDESAGTIDKFANDIRRFPKKLQTEISNKGVPRSEAAIDRLAIKYRLTPAQVRTLASLKDQSSVVIAKVLRRLGILDGTRANPSVNAKDNASGIIQQVLRELAGANGRSATTTITTVQRTIYSQQGAKNRAAIAPAGATGGLVRGPGTTTSDSIPALLSNKEFVVQASAVDHYGTQFMHQLNARKLAGGGFASITPQASAMARAMPAPAATVASRAPMQFILKGGRIRIEGTSQYATFHDVKMAVVAGIADYEDEVGRDERGRRS